MPPFEWPILTLDMDVLLVNDNARTHQKKRPATTTNPKGFRRSASLPEEGARSPRRSRPRRSLRRRSSIDVVESVKDTICRWHNIKISASNDVPPVLKRRHPDTQPVLKRRLDSPAFTLSNANFKQAQSLPGAIVTVPSWQTAGTSSLSVIKQVLESMDHQNIFQENPEEPQDDDAEMTMLSTDEDTTSSLTSSFESESER